MFCVEATLKAEAWKKARGLSEAVQVNAHSWRRAAIVARRDDSETTAGQVRCAEDR